MPNLITNILLGTLGVGSVVTAVAVPVTLANKSKGEKTSDLQKEVKPETQDSQGDRAKEQTQTQKTPEQWGEEDFKANCYGDFLKQEDKGELLVCLDPNQKSESSSLLFYFWWKDETTNRFGKVKEVTLLPKKPNWEISFYLDKERNPKILIVSQDDHQGLGSLQANSHWKLQEQCKSSAKTNEGEYQVKCDSNVNYEKIAKKDWFSE